MDPVSERELSSQTAGDYSSEGFESSTTDNDESSGKDKSQSNKSDPPLIPTSIDYNLPTSADLESPKQDNPIQDSSLNEDNLKPRITESNDDPEINNQDKDFIEDDQNLSVSPTQPENQVISPILNEPEPISNDSTSNKESHSYSSSDVHGQPDSSSYSSHIMKGNEYNKSRPPYSENSSGLKEKPEGKIEQSCPMQLGIQIQDRGVQVEEIVENTSPETDDTTSSSSDTPSVIFHSSTDFTTRSVSRFVNFYF